MTAKAALLEVLAGIEPTTTARDIDRTGQDRLARPVVFQPGILYGWVSTVGYAPDGTGALDLETFTLRLGWGTAELPEAAIGLRYRATSDLLFDKVEEIRTWAAANRTGAAYENLATERADFEGMVTDQLRGVIVDLSGYMLITT